MAVDPYSGSGATSTSFGRKSRILRPSDTDIDPVVKSVVCLTGGNITIVPVSNSDDECMAFVGVPAGYIVPFQVRRVIASTAIVASIED